MLPLFAHDLGAGPSTIGFVMGASTVTGVLLKLLVGAWSDILGRRPLLLLGAIVFATLPFTYLGVSTLAYITDATPRTRYGAAHGAFGTIYDIGDAAGPIAAGLLVATSGYGAMFQMMGGAGLTMAAVFLLTSQSRPGGGPSA